MASNKIILTFELQEEKKRAVADIAKAMGITLREVGVEDYDSTLGSLCGIIGFAKGKTSIVSGGKLGPCAGAAGVMAPAVALPTEMMVFSGLQQAEVEAFLDTYKKTALAPVALKAMITPTNISWTPRDLFAELFKEHQFFHGES